MQCVIAIRKWNMKYAAMSNAQYVTLQSVTRNINSQVAKLFHDERT